MKINDKEISFEEANAIAQIDNIILQRRDNGMLLSDYQIDILKNNGIDYLKYNNVKDLLFDIEEILNEEYDDALDIVSGQLAEYVYYNETNK